MINFNKDLREVYIEIKSNISFLKIKNKKFMDKIHNLDMDVDFWWAISGQYAIFSEYLTMISSQDPRFLNDLTKSTDEFPPVNIIRSTIIRTIGRDAIMGENFNLNTHDINKSINKLLIDEEEKHFSNQIKLDLTKETLAMSKLTIFLDKLKLEKLKKIFLIIKIKLKKIFSKSSNEDEKIFHNINPDKDFEIILNIILPKYLNQYFPKWFLWVSNYLVKSKHKWVTKFGYERNIYQIILMAKSYEKYGPKNIQIIAHGLVLGIGFTHMYWFSLFPNLKLFNLNENTILSRTAKQNSTNDILFCPNSFPWVQDFFSTYHFQEFLKVYKKVINVLNNGLRDGKKIKIRYKNFKYLSGYAGPHIPEECQIPIENKRFEDVYHKYKLIVNMPFGTISEKCYQNNINCLTYNYPYNLVDKKSYLRINTYPGVFDDADKFLNELDKKIKEI